MRIVSVLAAASLLLVHISGAAASPPPGSPPPGSPPPGSPPPGSPPPGSPPQNMITITDALGTGETNYPFQFGRPFVEGAISQAPQVLINGVAVPSQADVKNRYPDGSAEFAVISVILPHIPANGSVSLTFEDNPANDNTPLTQAQMQALLPIGSATMTLTPTSGPVGMADAGQMLADGNCHTWTSGPVAQTMECADDSAARKYDIGFGDGYHPFRPRFYVTFWPTLGAVSVRPEGENDLTTEIEDLAYNLKVTVGSTVKTVDLTGTQATYPKKHWTTASWILGPYWIGIPAPQIMVNIDNNLRYLSSTRFFPNFDPAVTIPAATITSEYTRYTGKLHDPLDGSWDGGMPDLYVAMGVAGASGWLAPFPIWTTYWLYTGDWRMRQLALAIADGSGAFISNMRESDPSRRFLRSDPVGSGTGLGHVVSIAGRPGMMNGVGGIVCAAPGSKVANAGRAFCYGPGSADWLPFITTSANIDAGDPWSAAAFDHQADQFYPQYILTGDPWYLNEMYMWMGTNLSGAYPNWPNAVASPGGRGPNGTYANINDELRGEAWGIRDMAETAFAAPDGSPEKTYFTYSTNDILGMWEGNLAITGTVFDGRLPKTWALTQGDAESGPTRIPPPTHVWQSFQNGATITNLQNDGELVPGTTIGVAEPWMLSYFMDGIGRAVELGFAGKAIQAYTAKYFLDGTAAYPYISEIYELPTQAADGSMFATWDDVLAAIGPSYLTGVGRDPSLPPDLPQTFAGGNNPTGRHVYLQPGMAMMVDQGLTTWDWWNTNVASKINFNPNPMWDVVPRTDSNVLPAQPTTTPP
jgi:hypothetical protein